MNMKKHKILLLFVSLFIVLSGCEKFTETEPTNSISAEKMIVDGASANLALMGAYSALQSDYTVGGYYMMHIEAYADDIDHNGSYPSVAECWANQYTADNVDVSRIWNAYYVVINRVNKVIKGTEDLPANKILASEKASIIAESKLLRAYCFFNLVNLFGGVPVKTDPLADDFSNMNIARSSVAEVYTLIKADLAAAATVVDNGISRANPGAYHALKAKVHLFLNEWAEARDEAAYFIDGAHGYGLATSYADLWTGAETIEAIWQLDFNADDGNSLAWFLTPSPGRGEVRSSPTLVAAFEAGDERSDLIGVFGGQPFTYKYSDVGNGADKPYLFRVADMILVYAEAYIRAGGAPADMNTYVTQIRNRAGLGSASLTVANWLQTIMQERRVELFTEGHRWFDLKRTGLADAVISVKPSTVANWATVQSYYKLWPIPQDELDANNAINTADQNPGY